MMQFLWMSALRTISSRRSMLELPISRSRLAQRRRRQLAEGVFHCELVAESACKNPVDEGFLGKLWASVNDLQELQYREGTWGDKLSLITSALGKGPALVQTGAGHAAGMQASAAALASMIRRAWLCRGGQPTGTVRANAAVGGSGRCRHRWRAILALQPVVGIHFGRVFHLCVEKPSELPSERRKYKGRIVFEGTVVLD